MRRSPQPPLLAADIAASPDPHRDAKLDRIEQVLDRFPDRVFAFDEFGPLGIRPTAGSCWAKQGKPNRLPATYRRTHGVTCRRTGQLAQACTEKRAQLQRSRAVATVRLRPWC